MATVIRGDDNFDSGLIGTVLQAKFVSGGGHTIFSQTFSTYSTFESFTITPKSSTSTIVILGNAQLELNGGNYPSVNIRLLKNGSVIENINLRGYEGTETNHSIWSNPLALYDNSHSSLDPISYELQGANSSGSSQSGTYNGRANRYEPSRLIVLEIEA